MGLITPETFWATIGFSLMLGEYYGFGGATYYLLTVPFIWSKLGSPPPPGNAKDPLDTLVQVCVTVPLAIGGALSFMGYGTYATAGLMLLWALAWITAPRRRFPTGEDVTKDVDLSGKTVMITGPTSGIGQETARVLALRGARVVLVSRNEKKLQRTVEIIKEAVPAAKLEYIPCDLSDQSSIRKCVATFESMKLPLHILINNAGLMALPERRETAQRLEMQVGVNHVGHFLLTTLLTPILEASKPSRVVCLSSVAHRLSDLKFQNHEKLETDPYHKWTAYGNSKMANIMFAREYHARHCDKGILAYSVHPGGIFTGLQGDVEPTTMLKWLVVAPFFFKSIPQGCATTLHCTTQDALEGGRYFENCKLGKQKKCTDKQCQTLYENSLLLIGKKAAD